MGLRRYWSRNRTSDLFLGNTPFGREISDEWLSDALAILMDEYFYSLYSDYRHSIIIDKICVFVFWFIPAPNGWWNRWCFIVNSSATGANFMSSFFLLMVNFVPFLIRCIYVCIFIQIHDSSADAAWLAMVVSRLLLRVILMTHTSILFIYLFMIFHILMKCVSWIIINVCIVVKEYFNQVFKWCETNLPR